MNRREFLGALGVSCVIATDTFAEQYPNKPIRWIVPYPPGGGTDMVSRSVSAKLSDLLSQSVVIDNRAGGATIIGTTAVAQAPADGYTIGLITDSHSINASFGKPLPYDSVKDFVPIVQLVRVPLVLVVNSEQVPMNTLPELVKYARANADWFSFGSLGPGSPHELGFAWFKELAKFDAVIVPYRGVNPAFQDVIAGHIKGTFLGAAIASQLVKTGKAKAIAITSAQRLKSAPDIPTFAEQGFPDYEFVTWYGMVAPRNTPAAIIDRLNAEFNRALQSPEVVQGIGQVGGELAGGTPQSFKEMMEADMLKYRKIIQQTGAKAE
jgi:tripartite-type tricarboxylate transporter receptor subunit TctC